LDNVFSRSYAVARISFSVPGEWIRRRQPNMSQLTHRLVFIDETGATTKMARLRGRAPQGQRLKAFVPFGYRKTETVIAGLRDDGLVAPLLIDRPIFEAYVQTQLAPSLAPGDVVIADNFVAHKSPVAEKAIRERGAWILYLPPDSPDLNPIEMAFSKLKAHLRKRTVHSIQELWEAIGQICDPVAPRRMHELLQGCRL
jgi:transposase